jgi:hypothetical protein
MSPEHPLFAPASAVQSVAPGSRTPPFRCANGGGAARVDRPGIRENRPL